MTNATSRDNSTALKGDNGEKVEIPFKEAASTINEVTETIADILNDAGAAKRLSLANLLGSDSYRFNQMMRFLQLLGSDLIRWGHRRVSGEDDLTLELRLRLLHAMTYVKHFEMKFIYFQSDQFYRTNWYKLAAGLALIGASIAMLLLVPMAEIPAVVTDALLCGSSTVGVSVLVNGLRQIKDAFYAREAAAHLTPTLQCLCDALGVIRENVSVGIQAVSEEDWAAAKDAGKSIVRHTTNVPSLPVVKDFWDMLWGNPVKLEDLLKN